MKNDVSRLLSIAYANTNCVQANIKWDPTTDDDNTANLSQFNSIQSVCDHDKGLKTWLYTDNKCTDGAIMYTKYEYTNEKSGTCVKSSNTKNPLSWYKTICSATPKPTLPPSNGADTQNTKGSKNGQSSTTMEIGLSVATFLLLCTIGWVWKMKNDAEALKAQRITEAGLATNQL